MASRLLIIAHAETPGSRALVFGDTTPPVAAEPRWGIRVGRWVSAPDPACRATAEQIGTEVTIADDLAGCDFGRWTGRALADVGTAEPEAIATWLSDPYAAPHGGETCPRCSPGSAPTSTAPTGRTAAAQLVVTPLVARALVVHALGAPPEVIFRIDVPPLGRVSISRSGPRWRLQELTRNRA